MVPHRDGLNVRAAQSDNAQVSIEMGQGGYDLDDEIEGLRTDVGRLKQVRHEHPSMRAVRLHLDVSHLLPHLGHYQTQTTSHVPLSWCDIGYICMQMSMAIGEENKLQKQAAETLSEYLEQADVALRRGLRRVNKALRQSKSNHLLYLALFCLGVFFMLYFLIRTYKLITWLH